MLDVSGVLSAAGLFLCWEFIRVEEWPAEGSPHCDKEALHQCTDRVWPVASLCVGMERIHRCQDWPIVTGSHGDAFWRPHSCHHTSSAAYHGPVSGPPHATGYGLSLEPYGWDPGGLWPVVLDVVFQRYALVEESGGGTVNRGASVQGLHAAHVGALCWPFHCHLHLPPLLWSSSLPPCNRATEVQTGHTVRDLPLCSVPVLLHSCVWGLHCLHLHQNRSPYGSSPLPLFL